MARYSHLVTFFTSKVLCFGSLRPHVTCEMIVTWKRSEDLVEKHISGSVWHKSFIETVKYSFPCKRIVYRSFYGAPLTLYYFYFYMYLSPRKVLCFGSRFLEACLLAWKKCNLSVVFAPWRWDYWSVHPRFYLTKTVNFLFNGKIISLLTIFSQL